MPDAQPAAPATPELPPSRVVVTSENRADFMAKKLDIAAATPETKPEESEAKVEPEVKAEPEPEKPKEEAKAEEPKKEKTHPIKERMGELAKQRDDAKAETAKERERAEKAEREAAELKAKLNPPKSEPETSAAPKREDFATDQEFEDAKLDWRVDQRLAERQRKDAEARAKAESDRLIVSWREKVEAIKEEVPDYEKRIDAAKVMVSNAVRDAIIDSDVGPRILLHLADESNGDAERISKMTPSRAVKEIGRLEDKYLKKPDKEAEPEKAEPKPKIEISKAPAPIAPLKGAQNPAGNYLDANGNFTGTPKQYRELRKAGKIT